jgi:hypothetical protein
LYLNHPLRDFLVQEPFKGKIEEVSRHTKHARLLSIPSGRLLEIQTSKADPQLKFSSLHALDLDEDALFHSQLQWGSCHPAIQSIKAKWRNSILMSSPESSFMRVFGGLQRLVANIQK